MKPAITFHSTIFELNEKELCALVLKHEQQAKFKCEEKQLFIYEGEQDIWTAIDNTTGNLFMEDFKSYNDAIIWLLDLKASEVLQRAEEAEYWW